MSCCKTLRHLHIEEVNENNSVHFNLGTTDVFDGPDVNNASLGRHTFDVCVVCFLNQGLPVLVLHEIQLLKDAHHTETEEEKISSSSLRSRLLGTLLIPPKVGPVVLLLFFVCFITNINNVIMLFLRRDSEHHCQLLIFSL